MVIMDDLDTLCPLITPSGLLPLRKPEVMIRVTLLFAPCFHVSETSWGKRPRTCPKRQGPRCPDPTLTDLDTPVQWRMYTSNCVHSLLFLRAQDQP